MHYQPQFFEPRILTQLTSSQLKRLVIVFQCCNSQSPQKHLDLTLNLELSFINIILNYQGKNTSLSSLLILAPFLGQKRLLFVLSDAPMVTELFFPLTFSPNRLFFRLAWPAHHRQSPLVARLYLPTNQPLQSR